MVCDKYGTTRAQEKTFSDIYDLHSYKEDIWGHHSIE